MSYNVDSTGVEVTLGDEKSLLEFLSFLVTCGMFIITMRILFSQHTISCVSGTFCAYLLLELGSAIIFSCNVTISETKLLTLIIFQYLQQLK